MSTWPCCAFVVATVAWVAAGCSEQKGGPDCSPLKCPEGHEVEVASCTCKAAADKCHAVSCAAGTYCDPASGQCKPRCEGIQCPTGHTANAQTCVCQPAADKCHGVACTGGQACNAATGACEASPGGGVIRTDLVNKQMSVGVHNNGGDAPNGNEEVYLDFNWSVSPKNQIVSVAVPPGRITIDGQDTGGAAEWQGLPETNVSVTKASELIAPARRTNGTVSDIVTEEFGVTEVKVRSAYDGSHIYLRAQWTDNTENSDRGRWIYNGTAWARDTAATQPLPTPNRATTRPVTAAEDRVQLLFNMNIPDFFGANAQQGLGRGCAGLCHLEGKGGLDAATVQVVGGVNYYSGKGRMYTYAAGLKADMWHWKATRSNAVRTDDDQYFDNEKRKGDGAQSDDWKWTGTDPACAGKLADPVRHGNPSLPTVMYYFGNEYFQDAANCPSQGPSRVPSPYARAPFPKFMYEDGSPFGPQAVLLDASFTPQNGDLLPGMTFRAAASWPTCKRCNNEVEGRWAANTWTVEFRRTLVAPDADDVDFTRVQ